MLDTDIPNPWRVTARREVYRNPWSVLHEDDLLGPAGQTGLYGYFAAKDYALICPLHADGTITLVRQWRVAFDCATWEFPCGACDGDAPLTAAQRELAEEAQLRASDWQSLGAFHNSDARVAGQGHAFLATGLSPVAATGDASEIDLVSERIPLPEALAAIDDGRINTVSTCYLLLRIARLPTVREFL